MELARCSKAPDYICRLLPSMREVDVGASSKRNTWLGRTILLTWMGPRTTSHVEVPTAFSENATVAEVCETLRTLPWVSQLWQKARTHCIQIVKMTNVADHAVCLEVCPQTYQVQKTIRLRVHMFRRSAKPMCVPGLASMAFQTVVPVVGSVIGGLQQEVRASTRAGWGRLLLLCGPEARRCVRSCVTPPIQGLCGASNLGRELAPEWQDLGRAGP